MSPPLAIVLFGVGLGLVWYAAEALVEYTVGVASGIGLSAFLISVVFIGFDPENLFVGVAGSVEQSAGIALGAIIGAAMVAVALAFGATALVVPLRFEAVPRRILAVPPLAAALFGGLALDGRLGRVDGAVLMVGHVAAVAVLAHQARTGADVTPVDRVEGMLADELQDWGRAAAVGGFVLSLVGIAVGSELLVRSASTLIGTLGLSDTTVGMSVLALLVSVEEVARQLPAALRGRPDISLGNVVGSVLAFFLFNAGIIALVRPVPVGPETLTFYLPVAMVTILGVSLLLLRRRVTRWGGAALVGAYLLFAVGGYLL
jgi:cation:H+ antiporter